MNLLLKGQTDTSDDTYNNGDHRPKEHLTLAISKEKRQEQELNQRATSDDRSHDFNTSPKPLHHRGYTMAGANTYICTVCLPYARNLFSALLSRAAIESSATFVKHNLCWCDPPAHKHSFWFSQWDVCLQNFHHYLHY